MSDATYNKAWKDAQEALKVLLQREREDKSLKPEQDRGTAFKTLATFYIKYMQVFHNLEMAYDETVCPQKQLVIQEVLEAVMGRILELKNDMVTLEKSEYHYFDDILQDLDLLPENIEIPIPRYFVIEKLKGLEREKFLAQILFKAGLQTQKPVQSMAFEEAIKMIQVAERARQDRLRATWMKQIYLEEKRYRRAKFWGKIGPNPDHAATCIQKIWRGFIQRKKIEKMREEEMIFLGMCPPPHFQTTSTSLIHARKVNTLQGEVQQRQEEEYQKALVNIKDRLKEMEGCHIKETLQYQIRQCFIESRHIVGKFPDYPSEEAGGSTALFSQKTPEQVAAELAAKEEAALQKKTKKEKKEKGKEKKKGEKKEKTEKKVKGEKEGWKMAPSNFLPMMEKGSRQYEAVWQNRDEGWNFPQECDPELIKEKREEVEEEIRVQTDKLMRQELKNLKLVVDKENDEEKKGKRSEGQSEKKGKIKKKKKSRIEEDLTPNRTIDSLYKELAEQGLLIKAKTVNLSDYVGEYSYAGSVLRQRGIEPVPSLAHVRQLIALYGILPLGSQAVHEKAPLVKAMLLAGPTGVGKKMLVHAICTETGANLFNLTASNIAGKYPGEDGLQMMLHMVFKVLCFSAKLVQRACHNFSRR